MGRGQNEQAKSPATFPGDNSCLPSLLISPGLWEKRRLKRELIFILLVFMAEGKRSQLVCLGSSPLPHLPSLSHNKGSACEVDSLQEM